MTFDDGGQTTKFQLQYYVQAEPSWAKLSQAEPSWAKLSHQIFTTHMEWNTQIFEQLLMSKGQGLMAKNKEFVTNFCIVPY